MEYNVTCQNLTGKKSLNKNQKKEKKTNLTFFGSCGFQSAGNLV